MGRNAAGVRAIRLGKGDRVISADVVGKDNAAAALLVVSENGYGKKTDIKEFKIQRRGGSGVKAAKVTAKTGGLVIGKAVGPDVTEVVAISKKSQVIRTDLSGIPSLGRQTQGVRIMKLREGDRIASFLCL